jgi:hypothetical protein
MLRRVVDSGFAREVMGWVCCLAKTAAAGEAGRWAGPGETGLPEEEHAQGRLSQDRMGTRHLRLPRHRLHGAWNGCPDLLHFIRFASWVVHCEEDHYLPPLALPWS